MDQQELYYSLVEELIEIVRPTRSRGGVNFAPKKHTEASVDLDNIPILRTTCKRKKMEDGKYSTHRVQGR